jgi:GNAT superfamily N-acetyltransferase
MRDLGPEVAAAYRKAREAAPEEITPAANGTSALDAQKAPEEITPAPAEKLPPDAIPDEITQPAAEAAAEAPSGPNVTTPDHLDAISKDVTKKLELAGRPKEEAQAAGQIIAAHYEARAARFDGERGNAYELFAKEAPTIRAARQRTGQKELAQRGKTLNQETRFDFSNPGKAGKNGEHLREVTIGDTTISYSVPKSGPVEVSRLDTKADARGKGSARDAMELLVRQADEDGITLALTAEPMEKSVKQGRLEAFYRSLGFKPNKGRAKDFTTRAGMIRRPEKTLNQDAPRQTDTPEFKRWFGDSKVVDADGKPQVVYHGTSSPKFSRFKSDEGEFFFTENSDVAKEFGPRSEVVYLSLKDPLIVDAKGRSGKAVFDFIDQAKAEGKDGVIAHNVTEGSGVAPHTQYVAFEPTQIKSATENRGTFNPNDPSILKQGKKGSITLGNARNTIKLFKDADASTFIHETGHDWLEELFRDAGDAKVKQFVKDDAATVRDWLGVKDGEAIPTKAHEKFARGFERYMMEGVAPSQKLAGVFAKFKDWLTKIYETVQKLRSPINDDIRAVFDRMLAESPEPVIAPERQGKRDMADFHEMEAETVAPEQAAPAADQIRADIDDTIQKISPEVFDELPNKQAGGKPRADAVPDRGGDAAQLERGPEGEPAQRAEIAESGDVAAQESIAAQREPAAESGTVNEGTRAERADTGEPNTGNELFGPTETEFLDKAGNIRLDNLNTPESVNEVIRQIATENGEFLSERRGVITDAEVIDLANDLGMDAGTLDKRKIGEAFNAEQIVAARKLLVKSATNLKELMNKAAAGTDADVMAYAAARDQFIMIQGQVAGITAEAGRALRAFRKLEGQEDAALMSSLIQEETGRTLNQLKQEAARGAQLDTPAKVAKFMNDSQKPSFTDMILEFWINSLLSGPKTHVKNMLGNTFVAINSVAETAVASGVGKILGSAERVQLGEAKARFFGITQGAKEGISAAKAILDSEDAIAMSSHTTEKANKKSIPGLAGKIVRAPGRALAMEDELFKAIGYRQELNALAYREASKAGLTGDAFTAKVAQLVTDPPEYMMEAARKNAEYQTFTNSLGPTGRAIQNFANSHFLAKFLVPFIRTPVNLLKFAGERSPLAPLSKNIRATLTGPDTIARDTQIARMALGTAQSIAVAYAGLALVNSITGGGPSDPKQRAALRMSGWQPYSVKVGDMYYSYQWLDPLATIGGVTADMVDIAKASTEKGEELNTIASDLMGSLVKSAASKTSLRGISSFLQMASDPDRYGEGYISSFAAGFVPAIVGQTNQVLDPVVRRAESPLDAMKAKIPGLSQDLLPRRDVWGNEMVREGALGPDIASSIYESAVSDAPVNKAMIESGYFPSSIGKKIRGVELDDQQYDDYSRIAGRMAKMQLDTIVRIPGFSNLPALERLTLMRTAVESSRESARSLILLQNPELIQKAIQAKVGVEMGAPADAP